MENIEWFIVRFRYQLIGASIMIVALTVIAALTMGLESDPKSCDQHWAEYKASKRGGGPGIPSFLTIPNGCEK